MRKKILSLLLALTLSLGLFPAQALATETELPVEEAPPVEEALPTEDKTPAEEAPPIENVFPTEDETPAEEALPVEDMPTDAELMDSTATGSDTNVFVIGQKKIFNGHTYQLVYSTYGWNEMKTYCESQGGYLACITTAEEDAFLYNYINEYNTKGAVFGLTNDGIAGKWRWVSGEPVNYTNWHSGEPNSERSECWGHYYDRFLNGQWNNCAYPGNCNYLIEWDTNNPEVGVVTAIGQKKTFNGHTYQLVYSTYGWNEMKTYCESQGGYLACITTAEEDAFLYNYINEYNIKNAVFGFTDDGDEGNWRWVSGEPVNYTNWYPGEPNNGNRNNNEHWGYYYEDCLNGQWNDRFYPRYCNYLIEWDNTAGPAAITFDKSSYSLKVDENLIISARLPEGTAWSDDTVSVTCSNTDVLSILSTNVGAIGAYYDFITIQGMSNGSATITVSLSDGTSARCDVTVGNALNVNSFDPDIYRATRLTDSSNAETATMWSQLSIDTPCNLYIPALQESGFKIWSDAWAAITITFDTIDKPSTLYNYAVKNKDIYSAVILDMLEASTDYGVVDSCSAMIKDAKSLVSQVNMILKVDYDIDASDFDWDNMDEIEQGIVKEACEKLYKEEYEVDIQSINKVFKNIGNALKVADCLESYLEKISSAIALTNMSESLKTVVRTMYQNCPSSNVYLKSALSDCTQIINSSTEQLIAKLYTDQLSVVGVGMAQYLVDELWDSIKDTLNFTFPYLDILLAGYKTGKFVSNTLFSTDSTIEQYCVMLAVADVENLTFDVLQTLKQRFRESGTKESAGAYLSAIDMMFAGRREDCKSAYKFVDILDDATANRIGALFNQTGANQREGIKKSINSIQTSLSTTHEQLLIAWVNYLEEDYADSGLYEKYLAMYADKISYADEYLSKKYVAACPVDVYVYDANDNLVAYVVDGKPYCSGNITVVVKGETKELYFYNDEEYRIEYVGSDEGNMDVTITEYNDGTVQRDVYFYDVPLTNGKTYNTGVDGKTMGEIVYSLSEDEGTVEHDLDTYNTDSPQYAVKMNSGSLIVNDELLLETNAYPDERLSIYAYVPEGFAFGGWTSTAGTDIFDDASSTSTTIRVPCEDVIVTAQLIPTSVTVNQCVVQEDGSSAVDLNAPEGLLGDAIIIAASYGENGQMLNMKRGDIQPDGKTVYFRDFKLEKGYVLFFLNSEYAPICKQIPVKQAYLSASTQ